MMKNLAAATLMSAALACAAPEIDLGVDQDPLLFGKVQTQDLPFPAGVVLQPTHLDQKGTTVAVDVPPPGPGAGNGIAIPVAMYRLTAQPGSDAVLEVYPRNVDRALEYEPSSWAGAIDPVIAVYSANAAVGAKPLAIDTTVRGEYNDTWKSAILNFSPFIKKPTDYMVIVWHFDYRTKFGPSARGFQLGALSRPGGKGAAQVCVKPGPGFPSGPDCLTYVPRSEARCVEFSGQFGENCLRYEAVPPPFGGGG
jgi:hypothetical protein